MMNAWNWEQIDPAGALARVVPGNGTAAGGATGNGGVRARVATNWREAAWAHLLGLLLAWFTIAAIGLSSPSALAVNVSAGSLRDTVRQADAIVVGTVTSHVSRWGDASKRWMQTEYTIQVEDVVHESGPAVPRTLVLSYWGGTIDGETQAVAGLRTPRDGERVVLMLHSRWAEASAFAPTVGFNQGLFTVERDSASGRSVVHDSEGKPLTLTPSGQLMRGGASQGGLASVDLATLTGWLRSNIAAIKAEPAPVRPAVDANDPRLMKVSAKTPALPGLMTPSRASSLAASLAPAADAAPEAVAGVPVPPKAKLSLATQLSEAITLTRPEKTRAHPKYTFLRTAHAPIVVNNFPASFAPWSPEDQYQMSKWNYYAADLFRVYVTPTGTYGWPDNVFDLAGWPSSTDLQAVYGRTWFCGTNCVTLAICFTRWDASNWIIEGDLAMNPGVGWTLDDEWVYNGSTAYTFRQSFIHELGHMHGLEHNFGGVALMNYFQPDEYRFWGLPFMDDAAGVRAQYPANAASRTDLGIYLFYENGICFDGTNYLTCIYESTFPGTVNAGSSFTVNQYHIENVGTTTIATPTIEWYLTVWRSYANSYYYLGTTTYSPGLLPFQYYNPASVSRSLTVPGGVPAGDYYLNAYIPGGDGGAGQSGFPFSNNYAWSQSKMRVRGLTSTALSSSANPSTFGSSVTFTATITGSGPSGTVTFTDGGLTIPGCAFRSVVAGSATCSTNGLGVGSHSIVASYGGDGYNVGSNSSTLVQVVNKAASATVLASSANPTVIGTSVTFTATVSGASPTGNVAFTDNGATISGCGAVALNASFKAMCTTSALTVGAHSIVATYAGNTNNNGSTSSTLAQTVNKSNSTTTLASSANPSKLGVPVTFTATVGGYAPAGPVAFTANGVTISGCGAVALNASFNAMCTTSALAVGAHNIVATYAGNASNNGSVSSTLVQAVQPASTANKGRDFNGDGKGDLAWRSTGGQTALWLMNGTGTLSSAVVFSDPNWSITTVGDFNGDGRMDLVWRNASTGQTAVWLMTGLTSSSAVIFTNLNWSVTNAGDFNGDGKSDLVWRNSVTGETAIWLMNGLLTSSSAVLPTDPNWSVTRVGDFNGDGKSDLVWRNGLTGETALGLMNGTTTSSSAIVFSDPNWSVTGVYDLNGDGRSDLVWRNGTTGQTAAWLMNGLTSSSAILPASANWSVTGGGDFNGDGKTDLVWRNGATGETAIWLMNGLASSSSTVVLSDPNWTATSTSDTNGDGKTDVIWRHGVTGQYIVWLMNGLNYSTFGVLLTNISWQVQNPVGGP